MVILHILCMLSTVYVTCRTVEIKTSEGVVVGNKDIGALYYTFYGIPYADAPVGENRFKAPHPPRQYDKLIANNTSIVCAQSSANGSLGCEDCLTLNIFTKNVTTTNPVLVWLEGENFSHTTNTATYSYKSLVGEDVVVVAVNYRLSIFGFLCLGVPEAPGNAGLKDVIAALKWIKNNIAAFGGDPDNVLLIGHGTGAVMVDILTMSSQSKDLFHKAIALSGSALSPSAIAFHPVEYAQYVAQKLNYTEMDTLKLVKKFHTEDQENLLQVIKDVVFTNNSLLFAPCIDVYQDDFVLSDMPINLLRSGRYNHIPYIAGFVTNEGTVKTDQALHEKWLEKMNDNFQDFIPADLDLNNNTRKTKLIRETYFGTNAITAAKFINYIDYEGDITTTIPIIRSIEERSNTSKADVRLLELSIKEKNNIQYGNVTMAEHGQFIRYILDSDSTKVHNDSKLGLINRILSFAKTGIPATPDSNFGDIQWLPYQNGCMYFLIERDEHSFGEENIPCPRKTQLSFWKDIYLLNSKSVFRPPLPTSHVQVAESEGIYNQPETRTIDLTLIGIFFSALILIIVILLIYKLEPIKKRIDKFSSQKIPCLQST